MKTHAFYFRFPRDIFIQKPILFETRLDTNTSISSSEDSKCVSQFGGLAHLLDSTPLVKMACNLQA